MAKTILVLSDGETWDLPENCRILTVIDEAYDKIVSGEEKAGNLGRYQIIGEQVLEETSTEYE
jgi:hypothetical protein